MYVNDFSVYLSHLYERKKKDSTHLIDIHQITLDIKCIITSSLPYKTDKILVVSEEAIEKECHQNSSMLLVYYIKHLVGKNNRTCLMNFWCIFICHHHLSYFPFSVERFDRFVHHFHHNNVMTISLETFFFFFETYFSDRSGRYIKRHDSSALNKCSFTQSNNRIKFFLSFSQSNHYKCTPRTVQSYSKFYRSLEKKNRRVGEEGGKSKNRKFHRIRNQNNKSDMFVEELVSL